MICFNLIEKCDFVKVVLFFKQNIRLELLEMNEKTIETCLGMVLKGSWTLWDAPGYLSKTPGALLGSSWGSWLHLESSGDSLKEFWVLLGRSWELWRHS